MLGVTSIYQKYYTAKMYSTSPCSYDKSIFFTQTISFFLRYVGKYLTRELFFGDKFSLGAKPQVTEVNDEGLLFLKIWSVFSKVKKHSRIISIMFLVIVYNRFYVLLSSVFQIILIKASSSFFIQTHCRNG
jgi:hypothetical protein